MTATDNSWVLVTGASSGFGEEFARQYAEQGHPLVLVARRLDRLQTLAEALRRRYRIDVVVEQVDLSDVEAVIQLHQRLREGGIAIDILINNAGHGLQGPFVDAKLDAALAMLQLDQGVENFAVYAAAKAYVCVWVKPFIANSNAMASRLRRFARACRTPDSRKRRNRRSHPR